MKYSAERRDFLLNSISGRAHSEMNLDKHSVKYLTAIEHRYRKLNLEKLLESNAGDFSTKIRDIYSNSKSIVESLAPLEGK